MCLYMNDTQIFTLFCQFHPKTFLIPKSLTIFVAKYVVTLCKVPDLSSFFLNIGECWAVIIPVINNYHYFFCYAGEEHVAWAIYPDGQEHCLTPPEGAFIVYRRNRGNLANQITIILNKPSNLKKYMYSMHLICKDCKWTFSASQWWWFIPQEKGGL